jgi:hypothetical protein
LLSGQAVRVPFPDSKTQRVYVCDAYVPVLDLINNFRTPTVLNFSVECMCDMMVLMAFRLRLR